MSTVAPTDDAAILLARARALARPPAQEETATGTELLEFRLGGATYALASAHVREVLPLVELTPVPCTPDFIAGVVNVRGRMTAVVALHRLLQLQVAGLADLHQVILLRGNGLEFGLLADAVVGVRRYPAAALERSVPALASGDAQLLRLTSDGVAVIDVERLLAHPRLLVHEEARP